MGYTVLMMVLMIRMWLYKSRLKLGYKFHHVTLFKYIGPLCCQFK